MSGTAVPIASIGVNGDFYLRTTTTDFYGPKTFSGWGTPINLRGPQGPAGPAGNANVVLFTFAGFDAPSNWSGLEKYFPLNGTDFNQSLLYAYVSTDAWYQLSGYVGSGQYYSVSYGNGGGPNSFIRIRKESGGIPQYFYSMRIYAVKANATIHLSGTNRGIIAPDGKFYADKTLRSMGERDFRSALGITEN